MPAVCAMQASGSLRRARNKAVHAVLASSLAGHRLVLLLTPPLSLRPLNLCDVHLPLSSLIKGITVFGHHLLTLLLLPPPHPPPSHLTSPTLVLSAVLALHSTRNRPGNSNTCFRLRHPSPTLPPAITSTRFYHLRSAHNIQLLTLGQAR